MRTVAVSAIPPESFANHRGDGIAFQRLLKGTEGSPDNFELSLVQIDERYRTPRHHHNFDQIHLVLQGRHQYLRDRIMPAGTVTYFPEGTYYGPQVGMGATILGIQMGGSTGTGFMSYDQLAAGNRELAERGTFENGIFRYVDESGRHRNQDGYEAIWEHVHGRPVAYPSARYDHPLTMWPEHFAWVPSDTEEGVAHKHLATFGERRTDVGFIRVAGEAAHEVAARPAARIHYVTSGSVSCGAEVLPAGTAIYLDRGESATYRAQEDTEIFVIGLPTFA
ncbi:hypothetical protein ACQP1K_05990 [Sphaerimonospora sp. CA-214678]|uniref:hypothetical protein n=1 Tax=Sphaerimonospora sp. CA-214678 TaxID=3240029 RepID=UPI003D8B633D